MCAVLAANRIASIAIAAILLTATRVDAQGGTAPNSVCWRFAFGTWTPALDWERSGHRGQAGELANRVQQIRDSVFAKDTNAVRNNAMVWEKTVRGWSVVLYPAWWPVGVSVEFDSVFSEGREMSGRATALVANASQEPSRARARAIRCT